MQKIVQMSALTADRKMILFMYHKNNRLIYINNQLFNESSFSK